LKKTTHFGGLAYGNLDSVEKGERVYRSKREREREGEGERENGRKVEARLSLSFQEV
jgi:hypothetical protein